MCLNEVEVGEVGFNAALAGALGIPIAMVTGDEALSRKVEKLLPWTELEVVKQGITSWSVANLSRQLSCELIRASAEKALRRLPEMQSFTVTSPIRFEVTFFRPIYADQSG